MTPEETNKQEQLRRAKPYVWEKFQKYPEKVQRGESIAILQFQYDYRCNMACEHCCVTNLRRTKNRKHFTIPDVTELSLQADSLGLAHIVLTGGEPLFFKDFDQVIEAIDPEKFYTTIDTNGWLLDKKRAKHLRKIGVDKVQLSLDSIEPDRHDEFRGKVHSFERAIHAIDACKEVGLYMIIATTVDKQRVRSREFESFLGWAKLIDVGVFVTFLKPVGAASGMRDRMVNRADIEYVHNLRAKGYDVFTHLTAGYDIDVGCIACKRMVSITKWGDVNPCPYWHDPLGNFFEEPLGTILARGMKKFAPRIDTCPLADRDWKD